MITSFRYKNLTEIGSATAFEKFVSRNIVSAIETADRLCIRLVFGAIKDNLFRGIYGLLYRPG